MEQSDKLHIGARRGFVENGDAGRSFWRARKECVVNIFRRRLLLPLTMKICGQALFSVVVFRWEIAKVVSLSFRICRCPLLSYVSIVLLWLSPPIAREEGGRNYIIIIAV